MQDFAFRNSVKILFGRGQIASIDQEIPASARVMMTYGGGSIKRNGLYEQVVTTLPATGSEMNSFFSSPRALPIKSE